MPTTLYRPNKGVSSIGIGGSVYECDPDGAITGEFAGDQLKLLKKRGWTTEPKRPPVAPPPAAPTAANELAVANRLGFDTRLLAELDAQSDEVLRTTLAYGDESKLKKLESKTHDELVHSAYRAAMKARADASAGGAPRSSGGAAQTGE